MIRLKRANDEPDKFDGRCFLVDHLWPWGVKKEGQQLASWPKDVAPSNDLRPLFGHYPEKWPEFQQRYRSQLDAKPESWQHLLTAVGTSDLTLVYGARDTEHNDAVALKTYLEEQIAS